VTGRALRILVQTRDFPPQSGGIAQVAWRLSCALAAAGHEVEVHATPGGDPPAPPPGVPLTIRALPPRLLPGAFREFCERGRPDLVVAIHWKAGRHSASACRTLGIPFCVVLHGKEVSERRGWLRRRRLARVLRLAARVVCVSRFTATTAAEGFGLPDGNVVVIPPGVDVERYGPGEPSPDLRARYGLGEGPVLLTVGRVVERKGHDMVIRALSRVIVTHPDARYVICGGGAEEDVGRLRALAAAEGVTDLVVFAGHVPEEDVADLYRCCSVCVMPSRILPNGDAEGFGITYLEAGACGKPVIGGRQAGVLDAIVDGQTGLLVDPRDPRAIGDAVVHILDDPDLAAAMGEAGRARVLSSFTWARIASRYLALLHDA
jgi:phosphatidylinositol alpha-1,6-mannosyltransferase